MRKADNIATSVCRFSWNVGSLNLLVPSGPVQACNGIALPLPVEELAVLVDRFVEVVISDVGLCIDGMNC